MVKWKAREHGKEIKKPNCKNPKVNFLKILTVGVILMKEGRGLESFSNIYCRGREYYLRPQLHVQFQP